MATFHVIYDPTNRLQVGPTDKLPIGIKFIAMKCDDPPNTEIGLIVRKLARLLLEEI